MYQPLADRLRPMSLDNVVGQEHILGDNGLLKRLISSGSVPNMIFFGPSGTGKTTVANIIAKETNRVLHKLNATTASVSDIKSIIADVDTLLAPEGILLYLDEIQYFTKKQQQSLLEFIENGKITLIASTTENPYFYVYNAILSRSTVFEFKPVKAEAVEIAVLRAVKMLSEEERCEIEIEDGVVQHISVCCGGDVRKAINAVEVLITSAERKNGRLFVTLEDAKTVAQHSAMRFERDGDSHFDLMSAFQKSIRGSDPDAAIYYMARMLEGGDMVSVCRRLLVTAAEDIGLAYPQAIQTTVACVSAANQLGLPEAQIPLAEAVILCATAPKSNSASSAIGAAMNDVKNGVGGDPPEHIRDSHYSGAEKLGRGEGYKYPHSFPGNYVKQQYLPDSIKNKRYYKYGGNKNEQAFKRYWDSVKGKEE